MKIILDENLPRALKRYFSAYEVTTVQEQGWAGVKNGELMARIDGVYDQDLRNWHKARVGRQGKHI
jgi:hypothetical protein